MSNPDPIERINELSRAVLSGRTLSLDEVKEAINLLRSARGKTQERKKKATPSDGDSLLNNLLASINKEPKE